jgi:hypothetical protein
MVQEHHITFGPFRFETTQARLWCAEQAIILRPRTYSDTPEKMAWEREHDTLMLLLHNREHQIQDLRQERDAWRQQAARAADTLVDGGGKTRGATIQAVVAMGEAIALRSMREVCTLRSGGNGFIRTLEVHDLSSCQRRFE